MKITREELQAIENHMSNIPAVAGMYTPVLIAWCRALLDNHDDAYRSGAEAMREACADEVSSYTAWSDPPSIEFLERQVRALPIPEEK